MKDSWDIIVFTFFGFFIILPLAVWKVIDIIIWICKNVNITIGG